MKRIVIGLLAGLVSISGWSACTYNLDATQTQITGAMNGASVFPSIVGSKASFTFTPNSGDKIYAAISGVFSNSLAQFKTSFWKTTGDKLIPTTGTLAFEFKIKVPTHTLPTGETLILFPIGVSGTTQGNNNSFMIMITQGNNNNDPDTAFHVAAGAYGSAQQLTFPLVATGYQKFGFYINQDLKKIGLTVNGVNVGYVGEYTNVATNFATDFTALVKPLASNASIIGETSSFEIITDHNNLTEPFPLGAKDICGNTI